MKTPYVFLVMLVGLVSTVLAQPVRKKEKLVFYSATEPLFQYTGRIDFSNPALPRFWSPGVSIKAGFKGSSCEIQLNDEEQWGKNHNYISVVIDENPAVRIKLTGKTNTLTVAEGLPDKVHTVLICKSTESGIGYLEFVGIRCKKLVPLPAKPTRKIEFIGNSITCGTGSDQSVVPCDKAEWYDQHNAYMSYGPTTARALRAQWQLSSVSGIGLIHSCCNMTTTMPQVFDKLNLGYNTIPWNFATYQPDVVTICLGQNDGAQDSTAFCTAYVDFIQTVRSHYPSATVICLTSPMADAGLVAYMKKMLTAIVSAVNAKGDQQVHTYFFSKRFNKGCGDHPSLQEHAEIATELTAFIKQVKNW